MSGGGGVSWYDSSVSVVSSDAFFMVTGTGLTGLATWEVRGGSSLLCHGPWFASLVVGRYFYIVRKWVRSEPKTRFEN